MRIWIERVMVMNYYGDYVRSHAMVILAVLR